MIPRRVDTPVRLSEPTGDGPIETVELRDVSITTPHGDVAYTLEPSDTIVDEPGGIRLTVGSRDARTGATTTVAVARAYIVALTVRTRQVTRQKRV